MRYHLSRPNLLRWTILLLGLLFGLESAQCAPEITRVSPPGLRIGSPVVLTIEGKNLDKDPRLFLGGLFPEQKAVGKLQANRIQLEIVLADTCPPGIQPFRIVTGDGISNARPISVDRLPQLAFSAEVADRPLAMNGTLSGTQILETTITGTKAERLVVEVESQRLGSKLKPVLRCFDAAGKQLAWSGPQALMGGDTRLELSLPQDGAYRLQLHDVIYSAAAPGFFRLKIGPLQYADLVFPLAVQRGTKTTLRFEDTNLPKDAAVENFDTVATALRSIPAPPPAVSHFTGSRPLVTISDIPEVVEELQDGALQQLGKIPVAINGRLAIADEIDRYSLPVSAGDQLRLDMRARRSGSPVDGVLVIRDQNEKQLATGDDRPGNADPLLEFTVPQGIESLIIEVRDLLRRGGADFVYRVAVQRKPIPDFTLSFDSDRIQVPIGSAQVLRLNVDRKGYSGPIQLEVAGLPPEISVSGTEIPAAATLGLLGFTASTAATTSGVIRIAGRGTSAEPSVLRVAGGPTTPVTPFQSWLNGELGLGVVSEPAVRIAWDLLPDGKLPLGERVAIDVEVIRRPNLPGDVRLRLLTTQVMPKKKVKKDDKEETVDDVERSLRLEAEPKLGPEMKESQVALLVPADLPKGPWGLALVAELLGKDGKTVEASAATSVRYFETVAVGNVAESPESD